MFNLNIEIPDADASGNPGFVEFPITSSAPQNRVVTKVEFRITLEGGDLTDYAVRLSEETPFTAGLSQLIRRSGEPFGDFDMSGETHIFDGLAPHNLTLRFHVWDDARSVVDGQVGSPPLGKIKFAELKVHYAVPSGADLHAGDIDVTDALPTSGGGFQVEAGDHFILQVRIKNTGTATSQPGVFHYFFAQSDASYHSRDKVADDSFGSFAPHPTQQFAESARIDVPSDCPSGIHYASYWIDAANTTPESNESNNRGAVRIVVTPKRPTRSGFQSTNTVHMGNALSLEGSVASHPGDPFTKITAAVTGGDIPAGTSNVTAMTTPAGFSAESFNLSEFSFDTAIFSTPGTYMVGIHVKTEFFTEAILLDSFPITVAEPPNLLELDAEHLDGKSVGGCLVFPGLVADSPSSPYEKLVLREGGSDVAYSFVTGIETDRNQSVSSMLRLWKDATTHSPLFGWADLLHDSNPHTLTMVGVRDDGSEVASVPFTVQLQATLSASVTPDQAFPRFPSATPINFTPATTGSVGSVSYTWYYDFDVAQAGGSYARALKFNGANLLTLVAEDTGTNNVAFAQFPLTITRRNKTGILDPNDESYRGVNVRTGNLFLPFEDLSMPAPGVPFELVRFYNSLTGEWSFSYSDWLEIGSVEKTERFVTIHKSDGRKCDFFLQKDGTYLALNTGNFERLVYVPANGKYRLYTQGGLFYEFEGAAAGELKQFRRLDAIRDRWGNAASLHYISSGSTEIDYITTDSAARRFNFTYITANGERRLRQVVDPEGRNMLYTWNATGGTLSSVRDVRGHTTQFLYNTQTPKRLTDIIQPEGNTPVRYFYHTTGRVGTITSVQNDILNEEYTTTFSYLHSATPPRTIVEPPAPFTGERVEFDFSIPSRPPINDDPIDVSVVCIRNGENEEVILSYLDPDLAGSNRATVPAEQGLPRTIVNPTADTSTLSYDLDGTGNLISFQHPIDENRTYRPTQEWLPSDALLPNFQRLECSLSTEDRETQMQYVPAGTDGHGKVWKVIRKNDPGKPDIVTEFTYSSNGLLHTRKTPNGFTFTISSRDPRFGLPTRIDHPNPVHFELFTYDDWGFIESYTNTRGHTWTFDHDEAGNLLSVIDPENLAASPETWVWDGNGRLSSHRDPNQNLTSFGYDEANNRTSITLPTMTFPGEPSVSASVQFTFDEMDRVRVITDPRNKTTTLFRDNAGRVIRRQNHLGHSFHTVYNDRGEVIYEVDEEGDVSDLTVNGIGHWVRYLRDELGRVTEVSDALGNDTDYVLDDDGFMTSMTDAEDKTTSYVVDPFGRTTKITDAQINQSGTRGETLVQYDQNGNITKITDQNMHEADYEFDEYDRMTKITDAEDREWNFTRDGEGNILTEDKPSLKDVTHTYDKLNRPDVTTWSDTTTSNRGYDANGNLTSLVDALGTSTFVYNERDLIVTSTDPFGQSVGYRWDSAGNRSKVIYPGNLVVDYGFDDLNRIHTITPWAGGTTTCTYFRNSLPRVQANGNGTVVERTYDIANRLDTLTNRRSDGSLISDHGYTLDGVGNITNRPDLKSTTTKPLPEGVAPDHDDTNRIFTDGSFPYAHDDDGRLTSGHLEGQNVTYTEHHDLDLIESIVDPTGQIFSAGYNGLGHRLFKSQNGSTTRFVLDQSGSQTEVLAETDASGNPTHFYVYGDGLNQQISASGNSSAHYLFDHLGSALAMTDSNEAVIAAYNYGAFGRTRATTNHHNPFRFVGRWGVQDDGNGLHLMRARYYQHRISSFHSQDVVLGIASSPQTLNRYGYGLGNPYSKIDPSGKTPLPLTCRPATWLSLKPGIEGYSQTRIQHANQALAHYRSGEGGRVQAGECLINEIKTSKSYRHQAISATGSLARRIKYYKLSGLPSDKFSGTIVNTPGSTVGNMDTLSIGSYDLGVRYEGKWTATQWKKRWHYPISRKEFRNIDMTITYNFNLEEVWDFEPEENYNAVQNFVKETTFGFIAGLKGDPMPFTIEGRFADRGRIRYTQERRR